MTEPDDDAPTPEKKADKKQATTTNITARVPVELKKEFGETVIALGSNESQSVAQYARWVIQHRQLLPNETGSDPHPPTHTEHWEHILRRELAAAVVLIIRLMQTGPLTTPQAIEAVERFFISGNLHKELT